MRTGLANPVVKGEEFEVNDELGTTLLQDYPDGFAVVEPEKKPSSYEDKQATPKRKTTKTKSKAKDK